MIYFHVFKGFEREIGLFTSILTFIISLVFFILFDFSSIDYQYIESITEINGFDLYMGIDSISLFFILLTT